MFGCCRIGVDDCIWFDFIGVVIIFKIFVIYEGGGIINLVDFVFFVDFDFGDDWVD